MKRYLVVIILMGALLSLISCSPQPAEEPAQDANTPQEVVDEEIEEEQDETIEPEPTPTETAEVWQATSPIAEFTDEDIAFLGIECNGDDAEIADCIKEWQEENFLFCVDASGEDIFPLCSALVETSEILPGLITSRDVIYDHRIGENIAGICLDYAATYCSIADYYGVECRIVRSNNKFCEEVKCDEEEMDPSWDALSYEFFIKPTLENNGLSFTLDAINSVVEDTWAHYWAEALIDGEWEFMDVSARDTAKRYSENDVVVVDWEEMDKSEEMYAFQNK